MRLVGVFVPHITPFTTKEDIDEEALRKDVDFWIENGLHGLVTCGSNGEAAYMTRKERRRVIKIVLDQTNSRVPVIAGTGCPGTKQTISLTKDAVDLGIDAALIVTPFFLKPSQEEIYRHYIKITSAVDVPLVLYNVPKFTGINIEPWVVDNLSNIENIVGIKDSSGDIRRIQDFIRLAGDRISIMAGSGNMIYPTLASGGHGAIVAIANVLPQLTVKIYNSFKAGDYLKAKDTQSEILILNDFLTKIHGIPAVKEAMNIIGEAGGYPRRPFLPLMEEKGKELKLILNQLKNI